MNKYFLCAIAVPLSLANISVNIFFWSGHVEGVLADVVASMWAVGLTLVEFLFPAWAIIHNASHRFLSFVFYTVGFKTAVFSILVFAMTIDNTLSHHMESLEKNEQAKIQYQEKNQLQKEITHIQLQAAQTAINAANKFNDVNKISLGTIPAIKHAELLAEKMRRSLHEIKETPKNITSTHPLKYLLTLEKLTGISRNTLKVTIALILGLLVEVAAVLSVVALLQPNEGKNTQLKASSYDDSVIKPDDEQTPSIQDVENSKEPCELEQATEESNKNIESEKNELALLARVHRDILMGKFGDIPKLSTLPQEYPGTGLRYHQLQVLREKMIQCGEAIPHGKSRMKLKREENNNE